jgi:hypothetical protein
MTLKVWKGKEHCTVNNEVSRHDNSLDADNNDGNGDEEEEV